MGDKQPTVIEASEWIVEYWLSSMPDPARVLAEKSDLVQRYRDAVTREKAKQAFKGTHIDQIIVDEVAPAPRVSATEIEAWKSDVAARNAPIWMRPYLKQAEEIMQRLRGGCDVQTGINATLSFTIKSLQRRANASVDERLREDVIATRRALQRALRQTDAVWNDDMSSEQLAELLAWEVR